jgi:hypothetical protein
MKGAPKTMRQAAKRGITVLDYHTEEGHVVGWILAEGPKRVLFHFAGEGIARYVPKSETQFMRPVLTT